MNFKNTYNKDEIFTITDKKLIVKNNKTNTTIDIENNIEKIEEFLASLYKIIKDNNIETENIKQNIRETNKYISYANIFLTLLAFIITANTINFIISLSIIKISKRIIKKILLDNDEKKLEELDFTQDKLKLLEKHYKGQKRNLQLKERNKITSNKYSYTNTSIKNNTNNNPKRLKRK